MVKPSAWFERFQPLVKPGGTVLDVAAGGGRHVKYFAEKGYDVVAIDKNTDPLTDLQKTHGCELVGADLEDGSPWPINGRTFDAVIVCNYLHRPLFDQLIESLAPDGIFLYETFARGNEAYNRPRNPDHLLKSGELVDLIKGRLQIVAYQHGIIDGDECPGVKQMVCAINNLGTSGRDDGEPAPTRL